MYFRKMKEAIGKIKNEIDAYPVEAPEGIEDYKSRFTGKKGVINDLFESFKELPGPEKATYGKLLNELKNYALTKQEAIQETIASKKTRIDQPDDLTLPGDPHFIGSRHPLSITMNKILSIFEKIGFTVADGPEIEDEWHNFDALNIAQNHPARDMQDTFFVDEKGYVLRTHTSNVQIRTMETQKPPIRILAPGRVYRNETISARAHCFFHQVEGLYVDEDVSFPDLMQVLDHFAKEMFGVESRIRLRPSYFPFTEISAEMDVTCAVCGGKGCNLCKYTGWVEIMGCGMVDPQVLINCGIDPDKYSGYAFGMGVERIAQLLYRVPDLRIYSQNDLRFLHQFQNLNA